MQQYPETNTPASFSHLASLRRWRKRFKTVVSKPCLPRSRRLLPLISALVAGGAMLPGPSLTAQSVDAAAPGRLVEVGSHRLHIDCSGQGQPTVVFEAGLGGNSLDWARVQPAAARFTRTCTYDRAGYGWSENGPLPRTTRRLSEELRTLLDRASIPGPYVLVGHSFGGLVARHLASRHPRAVAGLILVDAAHEDQFARYEDDGVALDIAPSRLFIRVNRPVAPANLPAHLLPLARRLAATQSAYVALQGEIYSLLFSAQQLRHTRPVAGKPLVVISRGKREWPHTKSGERMERLWDQLQQDFLNKVSSPRIPPRRLIAPNSGHYIHLDEPQIVVSAIRQMVTQVRGSTTPTI